MFSNRQQAGIDLAQKLRLSLSQSGQAGKKQIVVVALPRGGVPIACEISRVLGCRLDVLVSKKLGAPGQPELAIGAVTADGIVIINEKITTYLGVPQSYIDAQTELLTGATKSSQEYWRKAAALEQVPQLQDKTVILVDDGIATGMTVMAAAQSIRERLPRLLIIATPVISLGAHAQLSQYCDQIVALTVPFDFAAIGQFYEDFRQVEEEEVIGALKAANNHETLSSDSSFASKSS
jgi:putative phosphoribosyl transferase